MMYRTRHKNGNIMVVLIGLISVMLILVIFMSKRMTGHTQLLTLTDYTQINRYFLESYVGDVLQQLKYAANDPSSDFYKKICNTMPEGSSSNGVVPVSFNYKMSTALNELRKELDISCDTSPIIAFLKSEPLSYPKGINVAEAKKGKEKKGFIQITCTCKFKKREYKLVAQFPFVVAFRLVPIIKDFMLFVDNFASEQRDRDNVNIIKVSKGKYSENQDLGRDYGSYKARPMVMMQPLDQKYMNDVNASGRIYLGPSNKEVYINLAGGPQTVGLLPSVSETSLISKSDLGVNVDGSLDSVMLFRDKNYKTVDMYGCNIPTKSGYDALCIEGFCEDLKEYFSNSTWNIEDFLGTGNGDDSYWANIKKTYGQYNLYKGLSYSSALKLHGLPLIGIIPKRQIFGDVYARFLIFSMWYYGSGRGMAVVYEPQKNIEDIVVEDGVSFYTHGDDKSIKFVPPEGESTDYKTYMSRIVSGSSRSKSYDDKVSHMAVNIDIQVQDTIHTTTLYERNFNPADGFTLNNFYFHDFGKTWFTGSDSNSKPSPVEERIGRAFASEKEFKEAVGYPNKFKVNGWVYVKGNLNLDADINLSADDCGGGVVIVEKNIVLNNIKRNGQNFSANEFDFGSGKAKSYYGKWCDEGDKNNYIAQDKILTFVSLNGGKITVKGNVLLGVQLVNLGSNSGINQIEWKPNATGEGIVFFGSIACKTLNLIERVKEFSRVKCDEIIGAPLFLYPPGMGSSTVSLAVQIKDNMHDYQFNVAAKE